MISNKNYRMELPEKYIALSDIEMEYDGCGWLDGLGNAYDKLAKAGGDLWTGATETAGGIADGIGDLYAGFVEFIQSPFVNNGSGDGSSAGGSSPSWMRSSALNSLSSVRTGGIGKSLGVLIGTSIGRGI